MSSAPQLAEARSDVLEEGNTGEATRVQWGAAVISICVWLVVACGTFLSVVSEVPLARVPLSCPLGGGQCEALKAGAMCSESDAQSWRWAGDARSSVASTFVLDCAPDWYAPVAGSAFFVGAMVGNSAFGVLADSWGRKPTMMVSTIGTGVAAATIVIAASHEYQFYIAARFFLGLALGGIGVVGYVYGAEAIPPHLQAWYGSVMQGTFPIAMLFLAFVSLWVKTWTTFYVALLAACLVLSGCLMLCDESQAWQRTRARTAAAGGTEAPSSLRTLVTPQYFPPLLALMSIWMVCSLGYYALNLGVGELLKGPSLQAKLALMAVAELVSCMLLPLAEKVGRRKFMVVTLLTGAASCGLAAVFFSYRIPVLVFSVVGKLGVSAAFAAVYMITTDTFPAAARSSAVGACALMSRIGAISAPPLLQLSPRTVMFVVAVGMAMAAMSTSMLPKHTAAGTGDEETLPLAVVIGRPRLKGKSVQGC